MSLEKVKIENLSLSELHKTTIKDLKSLGKNHRLITYKGQKLAVIMSYDSYMGLQEFLNDVMGLARHFVKEQII